MKVTLNWLKQYVDFDWSPEQLAERLTMLGIEVEGIKRIGGEFAGIVVAQVISRDKHPNADKLSVCRVNDGQGERQIVCGADNFKAGDKVPLVLPGATLPAKPGVEPFTIKVGKIRGVESHGMMCSPQELGLPDQVNGLLILPDDAIVGQQFAQHLGRAGFDVVYDLEITPNRPDLNSVLGIAREISAVTGSALRIPVVELPAPSEALCADLVTVRLEDQELCPRYTARIVRGVRIGPSPDWLRSALEKIGIRSINNVVDVTNYVMHEVGQPLHAFDLNLLDKQPGHDHPMIVVRQAQAGESFTTLDGQVRKLTAQMLLIADGTKPLALAGIMGGQNSEIQSATVDVLVESAYFKPQSIRATSKRLELRTDSSYRFERGCDVGICDWASQRAVQLILETAGGQVCGGVADAYPQPVECKQITLRPAKANALLGLNLSAQEMEDYLGSLGIKPVTRKPRMVGSENPESDPLTFRIPTFRVDLKREVDLIEELVRLYGVDRIAATPPRGAIGANPYDSVHDQIAEARRILSAMGLSETQGQTLVANSAAKLATTGTLVALANPLSSDMDVLRPSLLPGLLATLQHNLSRNSLNLALFEVGRVFATSQGQGGVEAHVREERRVAIALTGQRNPLFWAGDDRESKFDIFDLKGLLEEFLEQFGVRGITWNRRSASTELLLESATVHLGKFILGEIGQLLPALGKQYDLREAVLLAELNLDQLLARRNPTKSFKQLPAFPAIRRDIAMLVPEAVTHEAVIAAVKLAKPANLEAVELFDVFRGKNVAAGQKSMAYAFTYRSPERTLVDQDVNAIQEKLVAALKQQLQASMRE